MTKPSDLFWVCEHHTAWRNVETITRIVSLVTDYRLFPASLSENSSELFCKINGPVGQIKREFVYHSVHESKSSDVNMNFFHAEPSASSDFDSDNSSAFSVKKALNYKDSHSVSIEKGNHISFRFQIIKIDSWITQKASYCWKNYLQDREFWMEQLWA